MKQPFFSIVLPVYNVEKYVSKSIKSLKKQSYKNFEVLLINDGSTDNSETCIKKEISGDSRFRLINQVNSGVGEARNKGLSLSNGKYVYFMDPDDWVADNLLEEAIKYISKYDLGLFVFGNYYVSEKEKVIGESFYDGGLMDKQKLQDNLEFILSSGKLSTVWDKVFKKEYLDKYNICFPDWKNGQCGGFLFSVLKEITSIYFNKDLFYYFRSHRLGSTTSTFNENRIIGAINKYRTFS